MLTLPLAPNTSLAEAKRLEQDPASMKQFEDQIFKILNAQQQNQQDSSSSVEASTSTGRPRKEQQLVFLCIQKEFFAKVLLLMWTLFSSCAMQRNKLHLYRKMEPRWSECTERIFLF